MRISNHGEIKPDAYGDNPGGQDLIGPYRIVPKVSNMTQTQGN
jgi:hypothetical protein